MKIHRALPSILLACALSVSAAACGSGSNTSSAPKTPAPATSSASAEKSAVAADWTAFFDAKTPVARRISLLQDGQEFAPVIKAQASSGLASQASAKVTKVTPISPTQAKVTYSILEGGNPALANQTGVAVYQDHTWKVGIASFCGLLAMENGGTTSSLPAACKTAR